MLARRTTLAVSTWNVLPFHAVDGAAVAVGTATSSAHSAAASAAPRRGTLPSTIGLSLVAFDRSRNY